MVWVAALQQMHDQGGKRRFRTPLLGPDPGRLRWLQPFIRQRVQGRGFIEEETTIWQIQSGEGRVRRDLGPTPSGSRITVGR